MKFRLWEIIVLVLLIVMTIISSSINHLWSGMIYITSALVTIAFLIFANNRVFYIRYMKKEYDEGLELYFIELYNNHLISREQLEEVDSRIVEGYYKPFKKLRLINIFVVIAIILAIVSLITSILGLW